MSGAPRVVLASGNPGKLREFRALLAETPMELVGLDAAGSVRFPEEGDDYRANARAKALAAAQQLGELALADDSGLEVEALGGRPGPHSARYGGPGLDDAGRVARLLAELEGAAGAARHARFVCWVALAAPDGRTWEAEGVCPGAIAPAPRGAGGFGYDPVFLPAGDSRVMAELAEAEKNRISHRARALAALAPVLREVLGAGA